MEFDEVELKCWECVKNKFYFRKGVFRNSDGSFVITAKREVILVEANQLNVGDFVVYFSCNKGHEKFYEYSFGKLADEIDFTKISINHEGTVKCHNCGNAYYHVEKFWKKGKIINEWVCSRCEGYKRANEYIVIDEKDFAKQD